MNSTEKPDVNTDIKDTPPVQGWPKRTCIVGLGLIGGSLALAIRRFHPQIVLHGFDPNASARQLALQRNVVHHAFERIEAAVANCDLVMLAAPVDAIVAVLPQLTDTLSAQAIVTDVGSTKTHICQVGQALLGERFIGGHPLTGAEHSGLEAADPFLFENALYALTPLREDTGGVARLKGFCESLGAQVVILSPHDHDTVLAHVSHLPQLVSTALCDLVRDRSAITPLYRELAAGGFRDLTRVAASPFKMWKPILRDNQALVDAALAALQDRIQLIRYELRDNQLEARFERAGQFRRELPWRSKGLLKPLPRIALVIEDRPGALVEVLQVLAAEGINIKDIELRKTREGDGSTFHLYVDSEQAAERGVKALLKGNWDAHRVA